MAKCSGRRLDRHASRFEDYDALRIEGDHLMLSFQEALDSAQADYGILPEDWRSMSQEEIQRIPLGRQAAPV